MPKCSDLEWCVCSVDSGGDKRFGAGGCDQAGVGYIAICLTCQDKGVDRYYLGESGRALRVRASEHLRDIRLKNSHSGLYCHTRDDHQGVTPRIRFQVRRRFGDPLSRQIEEGVAIEEAGEEELLNTRQEWVPPLLQKLTLRHSH